MKYDFVATTTRGLEDVSARELSDLLRVKVEQDVAKVFFSAGLEAMYSVNLASRTVNRLILRLARERVEGLQDVYKVAKDVDYAWCIGESQSFAVRAERVGKHSFTSVDVAAAVGQGVIDSYARSRGVRLKVDLDNPDVEILTLLRDDELLIGVNTTGGSLHRRGYGVYRHPASIKSTIAAALLLYCGWRPVQGYDLVDPMCGGGTIVIEAGLMALNVPPNLGRERFAFKRLIFSNPEDYEKVKERLTKNCRVNVNCRILGMDISPKHVAGAIKNAEAAGVRGFVELKVGDAKRLPQYLDFTPSFVVTNPPYGIRMGRSEALKPLYEGFLRSLLELGSKLTLVVISGTPRKFKSFLKP